MNKVISLHKQSTVSITVKDDDVDVDGGIDAFDVPSIIACIIDCGLDVVQAVENTTVRDVIEGKVATVLEDRLAKLRKEKTEWRKVKEYEVR